mmetsp:Transcript_10835/g.33225  ORF Transcript_10835/g.33225 Transcript_10835/m.33225 type:complete len:405 (-) Transcript_10835:53-1267(-)|eukprot:CAMPEP_0198730298 /NCGR_PEP_ID=MMETSP1475-20131203/23843_1 /TAXON_ID= ORGANISM="Unidentified sp., Strain CCMP1999" /NCGR_SAMPLE_ID=MMETSP1475 /ASSEMBLY_ACC=CAM_ASM_001111 /LENGTH=404 /DNA_ID=CAMNT_0044493087 /DNA_START=79 /DNA_END=1293 /DNA_ORIENTATION=-
MKSQKKVNKSVLLSEQESSYMMRWMDVTTATIYSGVPDEQALRLRVAAVVRANPWLAGTLAWSHTHRGRLEVELPTDEELDRTSFLDTVTKDFPDNMTVAQANAFSAPYVVPYSAKSLGKPNMLFRVTLVRWPDSIAQSSVSPKFILVVSIAHVIGDGHTFYRIYGMLSANAAIVPLNAERKQFEEDARELMGKAEFEYMTSFVVKLSVMFNMFTKKTNDQFVKYVNMESIAQRKEEVMTDVRRSKYNDEVRFISTNDVLAQWFMKECKGHGMMAVNLRNRLPQLTDDDAGNYENILYFIEEDVESPVDVRRTVSNMRSPNRLHSPMPLKSPCLITNWASFYQDLKIEGCEQIVHIPIDDEMSVTRAFCIIFKPTEDSVAMLCKSTSEFDRTNVTNSKLFLSDV